MKALTISQPYAELVASGRKWVENRTWPTDYRGPVAIHAGKGSQYLTAAELRGFVTGAVVATAQLVACVDVARARRLVMSGGVSDDIERLRRILAHEHCEGPYGFVLAGVRRLVTPIPYRGALGFWELPDELIQGNCDV